MAGVATICCKLFNIVQPTIAYFGQKDISQCVLIKRMVSDLNMPVQVAVCETVREHDGLALSSRNMYLTKEERPRAKILFQALSEGKKMCDRAKLQGEGVTRKQVVDVVMKTLREEPQVTEVEYISLASPNGENHRPVRACVFFLFINSSRHHLHIMSPIPY